MKFEKLNENKIRITLTIQDLAEKEIDFINKQGTDEKNEWYKCQLERLQKIINGEYS